MLQIAPVRSLFNAHSRFTISLCVLTLQENKFCTEFIQLRCLNLTFWRKYEPIWFAQMCLKHIRGH